MITSITSALKLNLPRKLVFGKNTFNEFITDFLKLPYSHVMILADPFIISDISSLISHLNKSGKTVGIFSGFQGEPTFTLFQELRASFEKSKVDAIIGIGGGSVLDVAKMIAALCYSGQELDQVVGIDKLAKRELFLACLPTTAGTGSEVSPNAILLDERDNLKKGIVSEYLVPDMAYVDPVFTYSVPAHISASTGIDALTHCIEAYANKYAHPVIDIYAMEGIKRIFSSLETACKDGTDETARENIALGSLLGGMCLGPVNTAAVHALAYPLGGEFKIAHGVSNAILLPHVMEMNLPEAREHYARLGELLGLEKSNDKNSMARAFIKAVGDLCKNIGIPDKLTSFSIDKKVIPELTKSALKVQRLLKNNLHQLSEEEISSIYSKLF